MSHANADAHPKSERTFVILKPDAIHRSLVGEILSRFERTGLKFVAMKFVIPTREQALAHYAKDDAWCEKVGVRTIANMEAGGEKPTKSALQYGKDMLEGLVRYLTCSPVLALVLEGNQSVGVVKKLVGGTEPLTSDVGTIRGDLVIDSYALANIDARAVRNLVHCSDQVAEAEREIAIWFEPKELQTYRHLNEKMLYDVNFDGILE
jgi:nucleoside-diphosphate kinase